MSWLILWPSTEKLCRLLPAFFRVIFLPAGNVKVEGSNTLSLAVSVVVVTPDAAAEGLSLAWVVEGVVGVLDVVVPPPQATPNRARPRASTVMRASFMANSFLSWVPGTSSLPDIRLVQAQRSVMIG